MKPVNISTIIEGVSELFIYKNPHRKRKNKNFLQEGSYQGEREQRRKTDNSTERIA
jgi:hypothetical protein